MRVEYRLRDDLFYCLECNSPIYAKWKHEVDIAFHTGGKRHPQGTMTDSEFAQWLGGPFTRAEHFVPTYL